MANTPYENYVLANEISDQFDSYLDLQQFCTVDTSLEGTAGMKKVIHTYSATNGTEKLAQGEGNTKDIEASFTDEEHVIILAQNRFTYYDEEEMKDPLIVQTGVRHAAVDLFNTVNGDIFAEFRKAAQTITPAAWDFGAFVDAAALLDTKEALEHMKIFAFVSPADMAKVRKALKDDLKYVEAFARSGYVGTVAGINLYTKKNAVAGEIVGGTREAVTLFLKKGVEVEQKRDANLRKNEVFSRKYYLAALTDATKAFKMTLATP